MILSEEFNDALMKKTHGKKLNAVAENLMKNHVASIERKHRVWDACFGLYCFTMGALNGVLEDAFVNIKNRLVPSDMQIEAIKAANPQKRNQDKKAYKRFIAKKIREQYPYYCPDLNNAVNKFNEQAFEQWMQKHVKGASGIIMETVDQAMNQLQKDIIILQCSVSNEMNLVPLPDNDTRSKVYTMMLLAQMTEELHLAWMNVGPVPDYTCLNFSDDLDIYRRAEKLINGEPSPTFDKAWYDVMGDGLNYWNIRHAEEINAVVVNKWTHKIGGTVDKAMEAIRRRITSTRVLETIGNNAIMETEDYSREREQLEQIDLFRSGELPTTLLHFECLRMMNEGKSNEEISRWLSTDKRINITSRKKVHLLSTVEILRRIEDGTINPEYFNLGMAKAHASYDDNMEYDYGNMGLEAINDMGKAVAEGLKEREEHDKEQKRINEDPLLRLSQKFNVTAMKPKNKKPHPALPKGEGEKIGNTECVTEASKTIYHIPDAGKKVAEAEPLQMTPQPPEHAHRNVRWTEEETNYLRKSWGKVSMDDMQKKLWRTEASIRSKAARMFPEKKTKQPEDMFA